MWPIPASAINSSLLQRKEASWTRRSQQLLPEYHLKQLRHFLNIYAETAQASAID